LFVRVCSERQGGVCVQFSTELRKGITFLCTNNLNSSNEKGVFKEILPPQTPPKSDKTKRRDFSFSPTYFPAERQGGVCEEGAPAPPSRHYC
jgi:hypothetical protein